MYLTIFVEKTMTSAYNNDKKSTTVTLDGIRISIFKVQKCTTENVEFGYCTVPRDTMVNYVNSKTQIVAFKKYADSRSKALRNNYSTISCSERTADTKKIVRKLLDTNYGEDFDLKYTKKLGIFGEYSSDISIENTRYINWIERLPIEFFLTYKYDSEDERIIGRSSIILYQDDDNYFKKVVKKYPAVELKYIDSYEININDKRYKALKKAIRNISAQDDFDSLSDDYKYFYSLKKYGIPNWFIDQIDLQDGIFSFSDIYASSSGGRLGPLYLPKQLEMEL